MADLVTRILLEDKQFNDKIEQSKKSLAGFEAQAGKAGGSVGGLEGKIGGLLSGGLTKLVGGFGLAATAGMAFKKIIDNSQTSADGFGNAIGAVKISVDQFFKSISTGDFSNFINGLGDVYSRALKAQEALDQLWNTHNAYNLAKSKVQYQITSSRADAYDRELSPEERRTAINQWQNSIDELSKYSKTLQTDLFDTAKNIAASYNTLNPESISIDDLTTTILIDVQGANRDELKKKANDDYNEYQKAVKQAEKDNTETYRKATTIQGRTTYNTSKKFDKTGFNLALGELNDRYKSSILTHSLLEKMTDEELEKLTKLAQDYQATGQQVEQLNMEINKAKPRLQKQIDSQLKPDKSGGKPSVKIDIIPEGSIAEIDKKLSEARKLFTESTTDEARLAADKLIKELESKKVILEVSFKSDGIGNIENKISPLNQSGKITDFSKVDMSKSFYTPDVKIFDSYSDKVSYIANQNRDLTESVYGMADAFAGIGDMLGENGGQWLSWGANVLTTVGKSLPALMALVNANTMVATTGGAASVSSIPIVGPIMAVAAVASILGAFANIPKYEHSGIVGGNSYTGDKLLARVNSGELILNTKHQTSLLNQLESSGSRPGNVVFKISGKELAGILNQESIRTNRR